MAYITLVVSEAVIKQADRSGQKNQRQIAIVDASPELRRSFDTASRENQIQILLCGAFRLTVGDTYAIWAAHQTPGIQYEDFDSIYDLLVRDHDEHVKFACS